MRVPSLTLRVIMWEVLQEKSMRFIVAAIVGLVPLIVNAVPVESFERGDEKWATVRGQIIFGGENVPEPMPTGAAQRGGPPFVASWLVHPKNKGVKNVFVWLALDSKDRGIRMPANRIHPDLRKVPDDVLEMEVRGLMYFPNSIGMRSGQTLRFKNSSNEPTNFKYQSFEQNGNVLLQTGKTFDVNNLANEKMPIQVESNVHPWMKGYVRVFDHPYFAITDEDGKFEIRLAPVGKMRLWLWHPQMGFRDGVKGKDGDPIDVKPRGSDVGAIKIRPPE